MARLNLKPELDCCTNYKGIQEKIQDWQSDKQKEKVKKGENE